MKTKLTLSVDKDLVQFARVEAKNKGRSISKMVSDFFDTQRSQNQDQSLLKAADMVGSLKGYRVDDSKSAIRAASVKKHLN